MKLISSERVGGCDMDDVSRDGIELKASLFVPWGEIVMMSNAAANSLRKETEASNTDTLIHCART